MNRNPENKLARYWEGVAGLLKRAGWREYVLLAAAAVLCGSLFVFAQVTDVVIEGDLHDAENTWMRQLRQPNDASKPIGPQWLRHASLDISALGGGAVLTLASLLVVGGLLLRGQYHGVLLLIVATLGGVFLNRFLKSLFARERPDIIPHLSEVSNASYPSGHSMLSAIVYLTLAVMLARTVSSRRLRVYLVGASLLVVFLIGSTRVYLGVHYPTDVVAGWAAGTAYALICLLVSYALEKRGKLERPKSVAD